MKKILIAFLLSASSFSMDNVEVICKSEISKLHKAGCQLVVIKGKRAELLKSKVKHIKKCKSSEPVHALYLNEKCSGNKSRKKIVNHDLLNDRDLTHFPKSRTH